jgi:hypothetical protein
MVGVDDVVADLKVADGRLELEVGNRRLVLQNLLCCQIRNWSLLSSGRPDGPSTLQVAVDRIDLLEPAQALAHVLGPPGTDTLHSL